MMLWFFFLFFFGFQEWKRFCFYIIVLISCGGIIIADYHRKSDDKFGISDSSFLMIIISVLAGGTGKSLTGEIERLLGLKRNLQKCEVYHVWFAYVFREPILQF